MLSLQVLCPESNEGIKTISTRLDWNTRMVCVDGVLGAVQAGVSSNLLGGKFRLYKHEVLDFCELERLLNTWVLDSDSDHVHACFSLVTIRYRFKLTLQDPKSDPSPNHGAIATRNGRRENMSLVSYYLYCIYYNPPHASVNQEVENQSGKNKR
jgi:hypothetical protein